MSKIKHKMCIRDRAAGEEATGIESLEQLGQITASGSYRLDADITVPDGVMLTVPAELNITLDLNGHKVEKPQGNGRILDNYGTMVINDSKGGGVVDAYRNAVGNFGPVSYTHLDVYKRQGLWRSRS